MKGSRVFITGISGFVGSHLTELCLKNNLSVSGTYLYKEELENIEKVKKEIDLFLCDVTDGERLRELISRSAPEVIFHLAAKSNVGLSWGERKDIFTVNFMGTLNLLEAIRELGCKARVLFVGSADEYGKVSSGEPITEDYPLKPTSPYAVSKAAAELLCYQYSHADESDIIMVRAFNHTGPRQPPTFVCSEFARQIARIEAGLQPPVINVGNLDVTRDFSDVRDVVNAYYMLAEKGKSAEIYNVCSGKAITIREILEKLLSIATKTIEIKEDESKVRKVDLPLLLGDNSKINNATGWQPKIHSDKTLEDILEFWRNKVSQEIA